MRPGLLTIGEKYVAHKDLSTLKNQCKFAISVPGLVDCLVYHSNYIGLNKKQPREGSLTEQGTFELEKQLAKKNIFDLKNCDDCKRKQYGFTN
eukprot:UN24003